MDTTTGIAAGSPTPSREQAVVAALRRLRPAGPHAGERENVKHRLMLILTDIPASPGTSASMAS